MIITQTRTFFTPNSSVSKLSFDNVTPPAQIFTLEPTDRGLTKDMSLDDIKKIKVFGQTAIPYGEYDIKFLYSPKFGKLMPHFIDVPDYTDVLYHPGNYPKDTLACSLVGYSHAEDFVGESQIAYLWLSGAFEQAIKMGESIITRIVKAN